MRQGETTAELKSIVGILTARTGRYSMGLSREFALAKDVWTAYLPSMYGYRGQRRSAGGIRPFRFIQDSPPRVENLTVGASEMRLIQIETEVPFEGRVGGRLILDEKGLNGFLRNNTGFRIREPFILWNGGRYPVRSTPEGWHVEIPLAALDRPAQIDQGWGGMPRFGYRGPEQLPQFKTHFVRTLFAEDDTSDLPDPDLGPFICGWSTGPCIGSVAMDIPVNKGIEETLLVADIDIDERPTGRLSWIYLRVRTDNGPWRRLTPAMLDAEALRYAHNLSGRNQARIEIEIPRWFVESGAGGLLVDLYWYSEQNRKLEFVRENAPPEWAEKHTVQQTSEQIARTRVSRTIYSMDDWRSYYDPESGCVRGTVNILTNGQGARVRSTGIPAGLRARLGSPEYFGVIARVPEPEQDTDSGGLSRWR